MRCRSPHTTCRGGAERQAAIEGGVSASSAWQLLWLVGEIFCVLAGAWFLALTVPGEGSPLAWFLALAFSVVCIAAGRRPQEATIGGFVSPGPVSYSSAPLVTSLWAFISAVLTAACARVGAEKAARGWAVSFVVFSGLSAYCFGGCCEGGKPGHGVRPGRMSLLATTSPDALQTARQVKGA